jgi:hypothetical protein
MMGEDRSQKRKFSSFSLKHDEHCDEGEAVIRAKLVEVML